MYQANNAILNAAAKKTNAPRCIFISSVGVAGTSWIVKMMLTLIGGKKGFQDYEKADLRVREETKVPYLLIRPYALTDKPGKGTYAIRTDKKGTFMKAISRADVAQFIYDHMHITTYDNGFGILLGAVK